MGTRSRHGCQCSIRLTCSSLPTWFLCFWTELGIYSELDRFPARKSYSLAKSGIFLVTFLSCLRVLFTVDGKFKPLARIHIKMVFAALAMFVFATLDVAFHLRHNLDAFVSSELHATEVFSETSNWINVISMGCYVGQTFVGDSILVGHFRLYRRTVF
jgi:hypothetical protein